MSIHDEFDLDVRLTSSRSMQESGRPGRTDATVDQITCQTCNGTCQGDTCQGDDCNTANNTCGDTCSTCIGQGATCGECATWHCEPPPPQPPPDEEKG